MDDPRQRILDDTLASLDAALGSSEGSPSNKRKALRRKDRLSLGPRTLNLNVTEYAEHSAFLPSLDTSISYKHGRDAGLLHDASLVGDVTAPMSAYMPAESVLDKTSAAILAQEDPGVKAVQVLFSEFVSIFTSHRSSTEVWSEVSAYERLCSQQADVLNNLIRKVPKNHHSFAKTQNMALRLFGERNTWRLLASLYHARLSNPALDASTAATIENKSDKTIVSDLYEASDSIREAQIVIDWLERNAHDDYEGKYFDRVDYFGNTHVAWENTLRLKKNAALGMGGQSHRKVLSELDPDAPLRENTSLHELDKEEDERLVRCMFSCIRAGQLNDAQDLCAKSGQHWRAATLEGWKLHHDPNSVTRSGGLQQRKPVSGNPYRDVWKSAAFKAAGDQRLNQYERAIYGSLCGHLPSMLNVCKNWEDTLWAYGKTLVDQRVEESLRQNSIHLRTLCRLPKDYPEEKLTFEGIFNVLESLAPSTANAYHQIQKYLILNDISGLVQCGSKWIKEGSMEPHLLRCLAHLILVLRRIWTISPNVYEQVTEILLACVKEAMERGDVEQVAWYTSTLPKWLQVRTYSSFLTNISEEQHRKHALSLADLVRLDVGAITTTVVANIRLTPPVTCPDMVSTETTPEDKILLGAIDWLLYVDQWIPEALRQANAIVRQLLIKRKVHAAKHLFYKLPSDTPERISRYSEAKSGSRDLPMHLRNRIHEYMCYRTFFIGQDAFTDWFEFFYQKQPKAPKKTQRLSNDPKHFPEQIKYEQAVRTYEMEMERWKAQMDNIARKALDRLTELLTFPDGFMQDCGHTERSPSPSTSMEITETCSERIGSPLVSSLWSVIGGKPSDMAEEEWELYSHLDSEIASREPCRQHQLETLRALYIPQACSLLQNILHCMERHRECIQLADLVASERYQLYKCFSGVEMQQFLFKLRDSAKELLDKNCDALGYHIV